MGNLGYIGVNTSHENFVCGKGYTNRGKSGQKAANPGAWYLGVYDAAIETRW